MIKFIRAHTSLWGLIAIWILVAAKAPILLYAVLPISVFLMRRSGMWQEMLFGFGLRGASDITRHHKDGGDEDQDTYIVPHPTFS